MTENLLRDLNHHLTNTLEHLKLELSSIRTNRAHSSLVEEIKVEAYESKMSLKQLASITAPEPALIIIHPYDKSLVRSVEKAIGDSGKGLSAVVEGDILRINLPPLSADRRAELAKLAREKGEEAQVTLRHQRHEILEQFEGEHPSEDEEKRFKKLVDETIQKASGEVKLLVETKEKDILSL